MRSRLGVVIFPTDGYITGMTQSKEGGDAGMGPALRRLLRPLVKALIAKGVTAPALYAILKQVYVETAREDFGLDGQPPTDSRVSVLTGVHRKDVRSIREQGGAAASPLEHRVTVMTTVVGRWLADPRTTTPEGQPIALPRQADQGPSFDTLVESVSTDVRPRTILDELLRKGIVTLDETGDEVSLRADALVTRDAGDERFHFFSRNIADHMAAAAENILTEEGPAPYLERAVFYNNLLPGSVDAIEARARDLAGEALSELNRLGFARQSADLEEEESGGAANQRFRFGLYFYREDEGSTPDTSGGDDPAGDKG